MKTVSLHIFLAVVAMAVLCAVGCEPKYTTPVVVDQKELTPEQRNYRQMWDATCKVLDSYYFKLDRQDRREGVITTFALAGKQWFEFWRKDSVSDRDVLESSMHTIYRVVKVRIAPAKGQEGKFAPEVDVLVFRSNRQTDDVDMSFSEAERYLLVGTTDDERVSQPKGYEIDEYGEPSIEKKYLAPLGHDKALEQKLATEIKMKSSLLR